MSSGGCAWIRYRDATGLKPPGERDEDSGQSEVLVAPQFGHGLDAEDLGKHLVVAFREPCERRRRSVENLLQSLVFVGRSSTLPKSTDVAMICSSAR